MLVGRVAPALDQSAVFIQRGRLGHIVVAVQAGNIGSYQHTFGVEPRACANAVAGMHGGGGCCRRDGCDFSVAQIGALVALASTSGSGQFLAMRVSTRQTAQVCALA